MSGRNDTTKRRKGIIVALKACAVMFFFYHCVAVTLSGLVPHKSALYRRLYPVFEHYLVATGTQQSWLMFHTIPRYRTYDVKLIAEDSQGKEHRYGPMLPGLKGYGDSLRSLKILFNYSNDKYNRNYRNRYLERAKKEIEETHGIKVKSLRFVVEGDRINAIPKILKGEPYGIPEVKERGVRRWSTH